MSARPIVFLSDYGLEDEFVGVCHAVMARISPESTVIDLTHSVPAHDVLGGALTLRNAVHYLPPEAVILAVVDPGVGTHRRPIAVETRSNNRLMVGPDNGVLALAWAATGWVNRAVEISSTEVMLEPRSQTFHGRDIFAPAAARLASGVPLEELGPLLDVDSLEGLSVPEPAVRRDRIDCQVLSIDRFGNLQLSARRGHLQLAGMDLAKRLWLRAGGTALELWTARTFSDVPEGQLALIEDSAGWLAVVLNKASAAQALGLTARDPVTLLRAQA
ncbi:MAG: SAM-dependent chlorinase/fluorinase [Actinomycetota bacterium]|nr:SAM-dependent chlorinase/fluorinase [Actinomycetota bacterium]